MRIFYFCAFMLCFCQIARADDFTIASGAVDNSSKSLSDDEVGLIEDGAVLNASGFSVSMNGDNSRLVNNGKILGGVYIVNSNGDNVEIVNNGEISPVFVGINSNGDGANIVNSGFIDGGTITGINSNGDDVVVNVSGEISSGTGVVLSGDNAELDFSGVINASSSGVTSGGDNANIVIEGRVLSSGDSAKGVYVGGVDGVLSNSGQIVVTGDGAVGVSFDTEGSNDSVFTNFGTIRASDGAAHAILGGDGVQNVTLAKGSKITGQIDLGGGVDILNVEKNGISQKISAVNIENVNFTAGAVGVYDGNNVHIVDSTSTAMLGLNVNNLALEIHGAVNSDSGKRFSGKKKLWVQAFGSQFSKRQQRNNFSYKHNRVGFVGGYDFDNLGVVFGFGSTESRTDKIRSVSGDSKSVFGGIYKRFNLTSSIILSANLIGGYERHETKRYISSSVNLLGAAHSDFGNYFISPSVELMQKIKVSDFFELRPRLSLSYTGSYFDEQRERGGVSDMNIKSRKVQFFNADAGLVSVVNIKNHQLQLGFGLDSRLIEEGDVSASVNNVDFTYVPYNDRQVNGRYISLALDVLKMNDFEFSIASKFRKADGGERQGYLRANFGYVF